MPAPVSAESKTAWVVQLIEENCASEKITNVTTPHTKKAWSILVKQILRRTVVEANCGKSLELSAIMTFAGLFLVKGRTLVRCSISQLDRAKGYVES